jgi:hypothetical protein
MIVGSRQPRHGIAQAKAIGLSNYYYDLAERFFNLALETQQEAYLEIALAHEELSRQYKAAIR